MWFVSYSKQILIIALNSSINYWIASSVKKSNSHFFILNVNPSKIKLKTNGLKLKIITEYILKLYI